MATPEPNGTIRLRLDRLEEDVRELKRGQPAVLAERVTRLSRDIDALRVEVQSDSAELRRHIEEQKKDVAGVKRILVGLLVSIAATGITVAVSTSLLLGT